VNNLFPEDRNSTLFLSVN